MHSIESHLRELVPFFSDDIYLHVMNMRINCAHFCSLDLYIPDYSANRCFIQSNSFLYSNNFYPKELVKELVVTKDRCVIAHSLTVRTVIANAEALQR